MKPKTSPIGNYNLKWKQERPSIYILALDPKDCKESFPWLTNMQRYHMHVSRLEHIRGVRGGLFLETEKFKQHPKYKEFQEMIKVTGSNRMGHAMLIQKENIA